MPVVLKDLASFIGLVIWFGDHLSHLAEELKPLREMEAEARKSKKLRWTEERRQRFEKIKRMVNDLPTLYFLNDTGTVRVYTDASDYAIGGFVCQVIDGKERAVGFMSKTLNKQQRKWSTTERECYAIFMTFRKYEYLLRDIPFELYTDHENLIYINTPPSNKVLRWKLAIQEYDFTRNHIAGEQNIVADGLSRLTEDIPTTKECFPDSKLPQEGEPNDNIIIDRDQTSREHVGHDINSQSSLATPHLKKSRRNRKKVKMSQDNSEMRIAVVPASPLIANGLNIPADIPGTLGTSIFDMDISDTQSTNTTTTLVRTDGSAEQPLVEDTISTLATSQDATDLRQPQPDSSNTPHVDGTYFTNPK